MQTLSDSDSEEEALHIGFGANNLSNNYSNDSNGKGLLHIEFDQCNTAGNVVQDSRKRPADETEDGDFPAKFVKTNASQTQAQYDDKAIRMMKSMGYIEGKGLGKNEQGRVNIVEESKHRGRRGLGLQVKGFEQTDVEWNFEMEEISTEETIDWIPRCPMMVPSIEELQEWKTIGQKKRVIHDETEFISPKTLFNVLNCKTVFDTLEPEEMRRARTRSNPFETIRGAFFLNRAAMKMANMDAASDFMFTNPKDCNGHPVVGPNELLYFADVCAGPGGFSEYVLWRKKGDAKGFGMTLKSSNDFKLVDFFAGPASMFEPHYGVGGLNGDGDVFNPENQDEFRKFVLENTDNKGVHFMMADGGFSVEGQENIQEILSKQLYLCQFLVAISILRTGGHFVCKLFDLFTPFSVGLVYLMYRAFESVSIFKPVTSRPANSERYILCKSLRKDTDAIRQYMYEINLDLNKLTNKPEDVTEVVPLEKLKNDNIFFDYIVQSNEQIGIAQAINLKKIQVFTQNPDQYEARQSDIRKECLQKWQIPDEVRKQPSKSDPVKQFNELLKGENSDHFGEMPASLTFMRLQDIKSVYDYKCIVAGDSNRYYILGLGRSHVFKWNGDPKNKWRKLEDVRLELPADTLIVAEFVFELKGEGKGQRKQMTVHALDALFLCGNDYRHLHFSERLEKLRKFVKAVYKPTRSDLAAISVPDVFRFQEIHKIFERLELRRLKGCGAEEKLCYCKDKGRYYQPSGIYFIKTVKDPWMMALSRTKHWYWYNTVTHDSVYECPSDSIASFKDCSMTCMYWSWENGVKVHDSQQHQNSAKVSKDHILEFLHKKLPHR